MKKNWLPILAVLALVAGCASKKNKTETTETATTSSAASQNEGSSMDRMMAKVTCTKGDETRTLEVVKKDTGCVLDYDKSGKMVEASSSTHGMHHCIHSKKKILEHLEAAGYQCS